MSGVIETLARIYMRRKLRLNHKMFNQEKRRFIKELCRQAYIAGYRQRMSENEQNNKPALWNNTNPY